MKRRVPGLDPELEALLAGRTIERRVPDDLRARAIARAQATVSAGGAIRRRVTVELPAPLPIATTRSRSLLRIAMAASIAFVAGTVGAVAALRSRAIPAAPGAPSETSHAVPVARHVRVPGPPLDEPAPSAVEHAVRVKPASPARARPDTDAVTAELELLGRAHAAYTHRDFSGALTRAAEHARRFPHGHLAEQREALRVRSLAGSGRTDEAHRAAVDFAARFPRSVLLPR
jgi:hypothetical protein